MTLSCAARDATDGSGSQLLQLTIEKKKQQPCVELHDACCTIKFKIFDSRVGNIRSIRRGTSNLAVETN